ncbi:MAG: hypothetical protein J1F03_10335 [Oscillospiraceae bacterium]|nr:hypothetical protein [Oscillospiraceae bacterium]
MKKEQFYELLGDVDERAVKAAENPPVKKTRKLWIKIGAVAAACLAAFAGFGVWYRMINSTVFNIARSKNMLLAAAVYPEIPAYPREDDQKAFEKWSAAIRALRDQPEGYQDGFDVFFSNSTRTFLSDAGTKNIIYSPLSLYMALGMSAEITDGDTRRQILDALAQSNIDALRSHAKSIWQANYMDDGMAKCVLATSLWTNNNITYNQNTVDLLASNYYSSVFTGDPSSEDYNKLLQAWLNEQTDGLLKDYVSGMEMDPETVLALASTVSYSGKWNHKFFKEKTEPGTFHSPDGDVQCDFMNSKRDTTYFWGDKFASISMGLENNGSMRLILPDDGVSVEELLTDDEMMGYMMSYGGASIYPNRKYIKVNMSIPKFDVSSEIDLRDGLCELGITDIFDPEISDFSPLTKAVIEDGIALAKAEQDTRVIIDEDGCKAASLTIMLSAGAAPPPDDEVDFILDRPFIFEIVSGTGLPLFVGIVNNPVQ